MAKYWQRVARQAFDDSREVARLHKGSAAFVLLGSAIFSGWLTWLFTGAVPIAAGATLLWPFLAGAILFFIRLCRIPPHWDTGLRAQLEAMERLKDRSPDTSLGKAIAFFTTGAWEAKFTSNPSDWKDLRKEETQIRQMAYDGVITIWGKRNYSPVLVRIPPSFWEENALEYFSMLNGQVETSPVNTAADSTIYRDLMVNRSQIEELAGKCMI